MQNIEKKKNAVNAKHFTLNARICFWRSNTFSLQQRSTLSFNFEINSATTNFIDYLLSL